MATGYGSKKTTTDGLVWAYDIYNSKCYVSGSGVAYDLVTNDTGSMNTIASFNSQSLHLDGTDDELTMDSAGWFSSMDTSTLEFYGKNMCFGAGTGTNVAAGANGGIGFRAVSPAGTY